MTELNNNTDFGNEETNEEVTLSQKVKNFIIGGALAAGGTAAVFVGKPFYDDYKAAKKEGVTFRQKRLERKQQALIEAHESLRERLDREESELQDAIDREHRAHEKAKQKLEKKKSAKDTEPKKPVENPAEEQKPDNATEPEKK